MFRKLLVPVDGSALAEQAAGTAAAIARATGAEIELVRVHSPVPIDGAIETALAVVERPQEERYLQALVAEVAQGAVVQVAGRVLDGDPAVAIVERADEWGADLVVMTTHGRTGIRRSCMGSVADAVVRSSSAPVLLLRAVEGKTEREAAHHLFHRILVALDGSPDSLEIVAPAMAIAECGGASLVLTRVVPPVTMPVETGWPPGAGTTIVDEASTETLARRVGVELAALAKALERRREEVEVDSRVLVEGDVGATLVATAHDEHADLVALTTHGRGGSRLLVGSTADAVLRGSRLAILLLRPARLHARRVRQPASREQEPATT